MDSQESKHIYEALNRLRAVTYLSKVMPFVCTIMFLVSMVCYRYCDDETSMYMDLFFYTSPMMCLFMLFFSYALKMCIWHKIQCLLPIPILSTAVFDELFYEMSFYVANVTNATIIIVAVLSLFNGYRIFCCK